MASRNVAHMSSPTEGGTQVEIYNHYGGLGMHTKSMEVAIMHKEKTVAVSLGRRCGGSAVCARASKNCRKSSIVSL